MRADKNSGGEIWSNIIPHVASARLWSQSAASKWVGLHEKMKDIWRLLQISLNALNEVGLPGTCLLLPIMSILTIGKIREAREDEHSSIPEKAP
jgi:hypothetical protein